MSKALTPVVLVSSQSLAASGTLRAASDVSTQDGGLLTLRITNGGTGPTTQCVGKILIAHKQTTMPATAAEGTGNNDWKQIAEFSAGLVASATARFPFRFGREIPYIMVEFSGHTGQAVTVEALLTTHQEV